MIVIKFFFFFKGEYVWIKPPQDGEFDVPIGAKVLARDAKRIKIVDDDGRESWIPSQEMLRPMHITSIQSVEDMIVLGDLQEYAILRNLQTRYNKDLIYV